METLYFSVFFTFILMYIFTKHFLDKIQNLPPTPLISIPIIGHIYLLKNPIYRTFSKISACYGPIVFLQLGSRPVLLVSSPEIAEECFTKNDAIFANRPRLLAGKVLGYNYTTIGSASYGNHLRNLRRICSLEFFSSHSIEAHQWIRADEVQRLVSRLRRESGKEVEMKTMFFELTLNVMMRMIAGKRFYGEDVEEAARAQQFREIVAETFKLGAAVNKEDFLPVLKLFGKSKLEKRMIAFVKKRDNFLLELIEEQRKKIDDVNGHKKTMIQALSSLQQTGDEEEAEYYTDELIMGIILELLQGGTHTSVGTMEWALCLLLNNPWALKNAQNEIDTYLGQTRLVNEADLANLPYLRSIVNETLRIYPVGPLLMPHESSKPCMVGGYMVPAGTMLMVNQWDIQRNPKIWVEPQKFMPERFKGLEGASDRFKQLPFGFGRRGCPGEGLALRVVGPTLGSLIQCFDWEKVSEEMIDMTEGSGLTLSKAQPLVARCVMRPSMMNLI